MSIMSLYDRLSMACQVSMAFAAKVGFVSLPSLQTVKCVCS